MNTPADITKARIATLKQSLEQRLVILDGGMGTLIQNQKLEEADFRGERFIDWPSDVKGNNDLLILSQPDLIRRLHGEYFAAGADIVETNTFNSTRLSQADYGMQELAAEINEAGARLARQAAALPLFHPM